MLGKVLQPAKRQLRSVDLHSQARLRHHATSNHKRPAESMLPDPPCPEGRATQDGQAKREGITEVGCQRDRRLRHSAEIAALIAELDALRRTDRMSGVPPPRAWSQQGDRGIRVRGTIGDAGQESQESAPRPMGYLPTNRL